MFETHHATLSKKYSTLRQQPAADLIRAGVLAMTYRDTLEYLYARLPMYHRVGAVAYKKDLTNTLALCAELGDPQRRFATIHVGGTNGKGSVSHLLAAVCQAAGLKTGLYVSPHYKDFRERIKIDGRYIPRRRVADFVTRHRETIERIQPSFFELTVALAFEHFARERVDIAVIEVGLGGRLDSTNVITPLLSVITNISYDHMNLLGDTLPQIAFEKAGIIKPGIPVVIGETHPESAPVFREKAAAVLAPLYFADEKYHVRSVVENNWGPTIFDFGPAAGVVSYPEPAGPYQAKNLATVLQAVEILDTLPGFRALCPQGLPPEVWKAGLENTPALTRFIGRWQVIGRDPVVLCDSAHNEAGLRAVFEKIGQLPHARLHIVTGSVNDKDLDKALPLYPQAARYYFAKADIPRGLDAGELRDKAATYHLQGKAYASVRRALAAARRAARPEDLVLVTGSVFVVAEVL